MTVASSTSRDEYNCSGGTTYTLTFGIGETSELQVILTDSLGVETILTETTHYSVSATNNDFSSGGTVTTVASYAAGNTITLLRAVPLTQEEAFTEGMMALYETFESGLDKLTRIAQQQKEELERTLQFVQSSSFTDITLPDLVASRYLACNAAGTALEWLTLIALGSISDADYNATTWDGVTTVAPSKGAVRDKIESLPAATTFATAAEFNTGTEAAKALAPDVVTPVINTLRDNVAILAYQLQVHSGIAYFNLKNFVTDEFEDETGVDTAKNANATYDSSGDYYSPLSAQIIIDRTTGTAIGDMCDIGAGGLAASFDGNLDQTGAASSQVTATTGYVGKDWGVGVTKTVSGFKAYAPKNYRFGRDEGSTVAITLQGSTDNFSSSIVDLGNSGTLTDSTALIVSVLSGITTTTAYRYHRLKIAINGSSYVLCTEAQFYEGSGVNNMTLVSNSSEANSQPTTARLLALVEPVDAVTINTDIKGWVSEDDNAHYDQVTLSDLGVVSGAIRIYAGNVNLASYSDKTMRMKITTLNNKNLKVHAWTLQWGA